MPSISDPGSRVVRVFISSTFRDFEQERNLLAKEVFPELRRRARERFVEVMEVDLRWGITQEQSEQGLTLPICLREIERARPYFIGLLGERYGWTPTPGQYPELLLDQHAWLKEHMGGTSVTELEILHGVLRDPAMAGRAYFYFRDPAYSADKGPDFRSEGAIERAKLDELKSRIRSSGFPVVPYATPHAVAQRIIDDLWSWIDAQYPADEVPDELERERRSHESYAAERRRVFVGQEATVAALLGRLESADAASHLTVVTGESGTGKSALLANVLEQYRAKHPHDQVIEHYLAAGYGAADPAKILRRLAAEIKRFTGTLKEIEESDDLLMQQLAEWLAEASAWAQQAGRSVIIALDGLDKLNGSRSLAWLPRQLPPHVRVVVSTLAGESLDALRKRGEHELAAQPFSIESARSYVIEALEKRRGKHLPAREIERIVAHPRATLPIFLKTLVDELSVYGSFEGLPGRISQCLAAAEPDDLFEVILARLEDDMGRDSVQKPLEAIWAAPGGLSDAELVGFTGVTPLELARLKLALGDALHEDHGMVMPAHDYLRQGIKDRVLLGGSVEKHLQQRLGRWWMEQAIHGQARACLLAVHHLSLGESWLDLKHYLTHESLGPNLLREVDTSTLLQVWQDLAAEQSEGSSHSFLSDLLFQEWRFWLDSDGLSIEAKIDTGLALSALFARAGCVTPRLQITRDLRGLADQSPRRPARFDHLRWIRSAREYSAARASAGRIEDAEQFLIDAIADCPVAPTNDIDEQYELELAYAREDLIRYSLQRGVTSALLHNIESELERVRHQVARMPSPDWQLLLTVLLTHSGEAAQSMKRVEASEDRYLEAIAILRAVVESDPHPVERSTRLAGALIGLAGMRAESGRVQHSLDCYAEALAVCRAMKAHGTTAQTRFLEYTVRNNLASVLFESGDVVQSGNHFRESLNIAEALAEEVDDYWTQAALATACLNYGAFQSKIGDLEAAWNTLNKGIGCLPTEREGKLQQLWEDLVNDFVWNVHLMYARGFAIEPWTTCSSEEYAYAVLRRQSYLASRLRAVCGNKIEYLDTCATYWEDMAAAALAVGESTVALQHARVAGELRDKITSLNPPA